MKMVALGKLAICYPFSRPQSHAILVHLANVSTACTNIRGARGQPPLTPLFGNIHPPIGCPLTSTGKDCDVILWQIHDMHSTGMPLCVIKIHRQFWFIKSYVFAKSTFHGKPLIVLLFHSLIISPSIIAAAMD